MTDASDVLERFDCVTVGESEGGWVTLAREGGESFRVPATWLPLEATAGTTLRLVADPMEEASEIRFAIDRDAPA